MNSGEEPSGSLVAKENGNASPQDVRWKPEADLSFGQNSNFTKAEGSSRQENPTSYPTRLTGTEMFIPAEDSHQFVRAAPQTFQISHLQSLYGVASQQSEGQSKALTHEDIPMDPSSSPPHSTDQNIFTQQSAERSSDRGYSYDHGSTPSLLMQNHPNAGTSVISSSPYMPVSPTTGASGTASNAHFPPRKSSLTHPLPLSSDTPGIGSQSEHRGLPGSNEPTVATTPTRGRATSNPLKPLPFIRPADIYKRMEEERAKERLSFESDSRSMDSAASRDLDPENIMRGKGIGEQQSSESLGIYAEAGAQRRGTSRLDPVREKRSEYSLDVGSAEAEDSERLTKGSTDATLPHNSRQSHLPTSAPMGEQSAAGASGANLLPTHSTTPTLPDLSRISGFGDNFWSASVKTEQATQSKMNHLEQITPPAPGHEPTTQPSDPGPGENQPSHGFQSVVDRAFDRTEDRSTPPTPLTLSGSQFSDPKTELGRSRTSSTISPIMSRGPTTTGRKESLREVKAEVAAEEGFYQETTKNNANLSGDVRLEDADVGGSPEPIGASILTHATSSDSVGPIPPSFRHDGHSRNLSTPSSHHSPARSPVIEAKTDLPDGEKAEIAIATPVGYSRPEIHVHTKQPPSADRAPDDEGAPKAVAYEELENEYQRGLNVSPLMKGNAAVYPSLTAYSDPARSSPTTPSPTKGSQSDAKSSGSVSPNKSKVRGLAEKFENQTTTAVASRPTSRSGSNVTQSKAQADRAFQRPRPLQSEPSFRPVLPGGWTSYATIDNAFSQAVTSDPSTSQNSSLYVDQAVVGLPVTEHNDELGPTVAHESFKDHRQDTSTESSNPALQDEVGISGRASTDHMAPPTSLAADRLQDQTLPSTSGLPATPSTPGLPPTPPPKDTPLRGDTVESQTGYFASPLVPRNYNRVEQVTPSTGKIASDDPHLLPQMSTETSPQDEESDKLRKEIVKSLNSPSLTATLVPSQTDTLQSDDLQAQVEPNRVNQGRDSTIFPSEYESYWASTRDPNALDQSQPSIRSQQEGAPENHLRRLTAALKPNPEEIAQEQLSYTRSSPGQKDYDPQAVNIHNPILDKISYQSPSVDDAEESISTASDVVGLRYPEKHYAPKISDHTKLTTNSKVERVIGVPITTPHESQDPVTVNPDAKDGLESSPSENWEPTPEGGAERGPEDDGHMSYSSRTGPTDGKTHEIFLDNQGIPPEGEGGEMLPISSGDTTRASAPADDIQRGQAISIKAPEGLEISHLEQLIRFTESEPVHLATSQPSSQGLLERSSTPPFEGNTTLADPKEVPAGFSGTLIPEKDITAADPQEAPVGLSEQVSSPLPTSPPPLDRFPTFQEICALKTAAERIKAYNLSRARLASMDTGLALWIAKTSFTGSLRAAVPAAEPSHPYSGAGNLASTSSPNPMSINPPGTDASPFGVSTAQQPYYQQYLNFSDFPPATHTASGNLVTGSPAVDAGTPSSAVSSGSMGGKASGGQVQAKGKDFLHSAGLFGGKANVAAKGLFAKGKSKWRSSGADKIDH